MPNSTNLLQSSSKLLDSIAQCFSRIDSALILSNLDTKEETFCEGEIIYLQQKKIKSFVNQIWNNQAKAKLNLMPVPIEVDNNFS